MSRYTAPEYEKCNMRALAIPYWTPQTPHDPYASDHNQKETYKKKTQLRLFYSFSFQSYYQNNKKTINFMSNLDDFNS
jgi:hypothetical protein